MSITEITPRQRMTEESAYARDQSAIAHIENLRFFPLVIAGGSGARLSTVSGRELIDLSTSWTASALGHGQPDIAEAIARAARNGAGSSALSAAVCETTRLAESLLSLTPIKKPERAYLGLSGSDANTAAIEAARRATGRDTVVSFTGSYHGGFGSSREVSGIDPEPGAGSRILDYPLTEAELGQVRTEFGHALEAGEVAAVIVEAIQCDGGVRMPAEGFLPMLREVCDANGTLLIVDEIKAGLARTGALFAFEHAHIRPDIVTLGKSLGGGLPLSAAIGPESVLDAAPATALLTNAGAPICAAAASTVLDLVTRPDLADHLHHLEVHACERIASYRGSERPGAGTITEVRGRGMLLGIEVSPELAPLAVYRAWELGAVIYIVADNVLELTPPLSISESELEHGLDIVFQALDDAACGRIPSEAIEQFAGW